MTDAADRAEKVTAKSAASAPSYALSIIRKLLARSSDGTIRGTKGTGGIEAVSLSVT